MITPTAQGERPMREYLAAGVDQGSCGKFDGPQSHLTDVCSLIARWAKAEQRWRVKGLSISRLPEDGAQKCALEQRNEDVQTAARQLLESVVNTEARAGKQNILSLLQATASGKNDWNEVSSALKRVRGWAVTNLSVRRFPPEPRLFDLVIVDEASQCSIPQVFQVIPGKTSTDHR